MIDRILGEIKKSIDNECFIAALALALTLPDICGKAEYPDDSIAARYIRWYNTYVGQYERPSDPYGSDMPYTSGELIYNLRNSLLHQGTPNIDAKKVKEERCKVDKFILTISDVEDAGLSRVSYGEEYSVEKRVLEVNIINLCSRLTAAVKTYYAHNQSKFSFIRFELDDKRNLYSDLFS